MADHASLEPFLSSKKLVTRNLGCRRSAVQWILCLLMLAIAGAFLLLLCAVPTKSGREIKTEWLEMMSTKIYGVAGSVALIYSGPLLLIALLATLYLAISSKTSCRGGKANPSEPTSWTNPVIVRGSLGVVSAAERRMIFCFVIFIVWALVNYLIVDFQIAEVSKLHWFENLWQRKMHYIGIRTAFLGLICISFLFIPVARGSALLRLVDIPFEHAVKYHVWMGHFVMATFTVHGLTFVAIWTWQGRLINQLLAWQTNEIANVPGIVAYLAGLAMWATSLGFIRKTRFELFFYTHQLYIVFIIFMALHVGDELFSVVLGSLLLFGLDRFLRFCQSRTKVGVLSVKILPCGTLELTLPRPPKLGYNSLSFIFLNVPSISRLQWHPFSVSSSPFDGEQHISCLIKPLGKWTQKLKETVAADAGSCPFRLQAAVEGPYGHEYSYFLRYTSLVLIAGGIGVSPFVAVVRDILHRYKAHEADLPSDVTLIWAVKKSSELRILDSVSPSSICPNFESHVTLNVLIFVTQESGPDVESRTDLSHHDDQLTFVDSGAALQPMSSLVATSSNFWPAVLILSSIAGYLVVDGLINVYYLNPVALTPNASVPWSMTGLAVLLSMILGVVLFGGAAIAAWHFSDAWNNKSSRTQDSQNLVSRRIRKEEEEDQANADDMSERRLVKLANIQYGARPDFGELFQGFSKRLAGSSIGVLVCGPQNMQSIVAAKCNIHNTSSSAATSGCTRVAFNYHSVSFDL